MDANHIIEALGGPGKVAELCEVSSQAVSQWKKNGIPKAQHKYLQSVRPDAFLGPLENKPLLMNE